MPTSRLRGTLDRSLAPLRRRFLGRRTVAFVFSGGGSLGAIQVGMLRALVEAGIQPDIVIGCSAGAINGAGYAAEPSVRGVARLERIWRRLASGDPDLMPGGLIPVAVQLARKGESLHDPEPLETLLSDELPATVFDELRIPFHCVATDLDTADEVWFTDGPLVPALMASASLPAVYPAREYQGRTFIDGGVLNEVHTDRALELGATEIYLLHVGHLDDRTTDVQRPFDSALRAYWIARRWRLEENIRSVPPNCTLHMLPAGAPPRLRFNDFTRGPDLAEIAYEQTAEYLATGNTFLEPSDRPDEHRRGGEPRVAALEVEEALGSHVGSEAFLGEQELAHAGADAVGDDGAPRVRERLHPAQLDGADQDDSHRSGDADLLRDHRIAGHGGADDDPAEPAP